MPGTDQLVMDDRTAPSHGKLLFDDRDGVGTGKLVFDDKRASAEVVVTITGVTRDSQDDILPAGEYTLAWTGSHYEWSTSDYGGVELTLIPGTGILACLFFITMEQPTRFGRSSWWSAAIEGAYSNTTNFYLVAWPTAVEVDRVESWE